MFISKEIENWAQVTNYFSTELPSGFISLEEHRAKRSTFSSLQQHLCGTAFCINSVWGAQIYYNMKEQNRNNAVDMVKYPDRSTLLSGMACMDWRWRNNRMTSLRKCPGPLWWTASFSLSSVSQYLTALTDHATGSLRVEHILHPWTQLLSFSSMAAESWIWGSSVSKDVSRVGNQPLPPG